MAVAEVKAELDRLEQALGPNPDVGLPEKSDELLARLAFVRAIKASGVKPVYTPPDTHRTASYELLIVQAEEEEAAAARRETPAFDPLLDEWWRAEVAAEGCWEHERHGRFCHLWVWLGRALHRSSFEDVERVISEALQKATAREARQHEAATARKQEEPRWSTAEALAWISDRSIDGVLRRQGLSDSDNLVVVMRRTADGQLAIEALRDACRSGDVEAWGNKDGASGKQQIPAVDWDDMQIVFSWNEFRAGDWSRLFFDRAQLFRAFPASRPAHASVARTAVQASRAQEEARTFILSHRNRGTKVTQQEVREHVEAGGHHVADADPGRWWGTFNDDPEIKHLIQGRGRPRNKANKNPAGKSRAQIPHQ